MRTLPVALFLGTSAWSFVYVSLPFYIQRISTEDPASTLRWTGWGRRPGDAEVLS